MPVLPLAALAPQPRKEKKVRAKWSLLAKAGKKNGGNAAVEMAGSVETLGVDLRKQNETVGSKKQKARRKKCKCEVLARQERSGLPEKLHGDRSEEVFEDRLGSCESAGGQAVGVAPTERHNLRRQMAAAVGKKESVSLSFFLDVKELEVERSFRRWPRKRGQRNTDW